MRSGNGRGVHKWGNCVMLVLLLHMNWASRTKLVARTVDSNFLTIFLRYSLGTWSLDSFPLVWDPAPLIIAGSHDATPCYKALVGEL
jgi:hypothetical protein